MNYLDPEFSTLPAGWSARPLREIVEIHNTKRVPLNGRDRERRQGSYPYCGANGIVDHIDDFRFDGEYVLIAEDGGHWGKQESSSYIMRGKFWVNNHAHAVRAIPDVTTNEFLSFMVNYLNIQPFIGGDARGKLTKAILEQLGIPLPPLPEQKKISHILSTVQRAIKQQERIIQTTTELKKALMHKLLTEGLRNEPQKQTEVGLIPKSWEVVEIGDVFKFTSGKTKPKDTSREPTAEQTIPVYGGNGVLGYSAQSLLNEDVLILGRVGEYCGCAHLTKPISWVTDNALYAIEEKRSVNRSYARTHFEHLNLNQYSNKMGQPLITQGTINRVKFGFPSRSEQNELANAFENLNTRIAQIQAKRNSLQDLFRTLLHELMTAKTRIHGIK